MGHKWGEDVGPLLDALTDIHIGSLVSDNVAADEGVNCFSASSGAGGHDVDDVGSIGGDAHASSALCIKSEFRDNGPHGMEFDVVLISECLWKHDQVFLTFLLSALAKIISHESTKICFVQLWGV